MSVEGAHWRMRFRATRQGDSSTALFIFMIVSFNHIASQIAFSSPIVMLRCIVCRRRHPCSGSDGKGKRDRRS